MNFTVRLLPSALSEGVRKGAHYGALPKSSGGGLSLRERSVNRMSLKLTAEGQVLERNTRSGVPNHLKFDHFSFKLL
jgi:hypothetical protein